MAGETKDVGAVVLDITARRQAEEALKHAYDDLEQRVSERTVELRSAQSQLVQASKLAAVGELGAGMAHELNQPLTAIQLMLEMIRASPKARVGQYSEDLETSLDQCRRMGKIIDSVRAFARKGDLEVEALDATGALDDALVLVSEQFRLAEIEVVVDIQDPLPSVRADPLRLQQIFMNLLGNALHALEGMRGGTGKKILARAQKGTGGLHGAG